MSQAFYLADRAAFTDATALIADYGALAELEAERRAGHSRALGNVVHFCRWRQIGRTIGLLRGEDVTGSIH